MTTILRLFAWLLAAAVTFATLGPPRFRPHSSFGQDGEHAIAFVLIGLAFGLAYSRHRLLTSAISLVMIGTIEILQIWAPGRHARLKISRSMHSRPLSASPPQPRWNGRSSDRGDPMSARPDTRNPRGTGSREDCLMAYCVLVDDLDDLARPRLDDHAPVIDDRIAIFAVARHRPQFDGWRFQRPEQRGKKTP
jgi:hypothetical protein